MKQKVILILTLMLCGLAMTLAFIGRAGVQIQAIRQPRG